MNINEIVSGALDSARQTLGIDAEEKAPDALTLLKNDHDEVKALFKQVLEDDSDLLRAQRTTIAKIISALELHAKLEETLLYPAIHSKTKRDTEDRHGVLEAVEEHGSMKDLMKKIKRSDGRDDTIRAKVQVLSEIV
jgi:hemerythrin superfamily protein